MLNCVKVRSSALGYAKLRYFVKIVYTHVIYRTCIYVKVRYLTSIISIRGAQDSAPSKVTVELADGSFAPESKPSDDIEVG